MFQPVSYQLNFLCFLNYVILYTLLYWMKIFIFSYIFLNWIFLEKCLTCFFHILAQNIIMTGFLWDYYIVHLIFQISLLSQLSSFRLVLDIAYWMPCNQINLGLPFFYSVALKQSLNHTFSILLMHIYYSSHLIVEYLCMLNSINVHCLITLLLTCWV